MKKKAKKQSSVHGAAVVLGRRGGIKGGPARAKKLTRARRKAIAAKAGRARQS